MGYGVGFAVGFGVGFVVGFAVGFAVGFDVVGFDVVGSAVGVEVVGVDVVGVAEVGSAVCARLGVFVGPPDGALDDAADGAGEPDVAILATDGQLLQHSGSVLSSPPPPPPLLRPCSRRDGLHMELSQEQELESVDSTQLTSDLGTRSGSSVWSSLHLSSDPRANDIHRTDRSKPRTATTASLIAYQLCPTHTEQMKDAHLGAFSSESSEKMHSSSLVFFGTAN